MRKLAAIIILMAAPAATRAQISAIGQFGCNAAPVTGTAWTSATALNTTQILASGVAGNQVLVTLDQTTTITGGAISFLGDAGDGNFVTLNAWQVVDPTTAPFATISLPYTLQASTNKQFIVQMAGYSRLQLKLTTAITGTATVTPFTTIVCYGLQLAYQAANANLNASVTFPLAQAVNNTQQGTASQNVVQFGGTNVSTGTGAGGAGIPRVTISNDSSLAANQSVNVTQVAGTATDTNSGNSSAGTQRHVVATNNPAIANWGHGATGSAVSANVTMEGLKDTAGNAQDALGDTNGRQFFKPYPDTTTTSYHASASVTLAASATDVAVMPGNATNTVLVTRVIVSGTQTTAGVVTMNLIKRSTADTAGTSANMTVVPDDANYAAGVSVPKTYTANPTTGTPVGNVDTVAFGLMATGTTSPNDIYIFKPLKPIVLRGTAQQLCVNMNSATITGGVVLVTFEYEETTTP